MGQLKFSVDFTNGIRWVREMQGVKSTNQTNDWEKKKELIVKSRQDWYIHYVHNSPPYLKNKQQKTKRMHRSRTGVIWWQHLPCAKSKIVILSGTAVKEQRANHHIVEASCPRPSRTITVGCLWVHENLQYANMLWIYWKYCLLRTMLRFPSILTSS